jgi:hypothetical protein
MAGARAIFLFKNQKINKFANNKGWIFGGTKTKRGIRLAQEKPTHLN